MSKASKYILILIALHSCSGNKGMDRFSWIQGNWKGHDQEIQYFENWKKTSEDIMSGGSYVFQNGDTVYRENLKIELIGETPCYVLTRPDTKEPVIYKMSDEKDKKVVFENKEHEFPEVITYEMKGDSLHACFDGIRDKQKAREEVYFHKK